MSKVSWGKTLGGVALATGAAVMGVGLGGEALAEAIGPEGPVASGLSSAAETVNSTGADVVRATGLEDKISGKTAAAIAGGALAAAGVTTILASRDGDATDPQAGTEEEIAKMKEIRRRIRIQEQEQGIDIDGDGVIANVPSAKEPDNGREH